MKNLKEIKIKLLLAFIASTILFAGCSHIHGNGKHATNKRQLAAFNAINLEGGYKVNIHIEKNVKHYCLISGDENIIPLITTEVSDNTLDISSRRSIETNLPLTLDVYTDSLNKLNISGAGEINVDNISDKNFSLDLQGAADINLSGKTDMLTINCQGASNIKAKGLNAANASIILKGAGNVVIFVTGNLQTDISGIGSITYYGNPKIIAKEISGLGQIKQSKDK